MPRTLTPTEKTHLLRFKPDALDTIEIYGEMPVEYISGTAEFCDLLFTVNPDVLIPRLETEELVALAQAHILKLQAKNPNEISHICEVGTGCGAVAITLQHRLRSHRTNIVASDVSQSAINVAELNVQKLLLDTGAEPIHCVVSDLFTSFPAQQTYDVIIANLPYIPNERIAYLDSSVKDFEPHLALDGGTDGLQLIKKMLQQALDFTHPNSLVFLEVDYTHTKAEFNDFEKEWHIETIEDQFYRQRFVKLTRL